MNYLRDYEKETMNSTSQEMLDKAIEALKKHQKECNYCNQSPSSEGSIIGEVDEFDDCHIRHYLMEECEFYQEELKSK